MPDLSDLRKALPSIFGYMRAMENPASRPNNGDAGLRVDARPAHLHVEADLDVGVPSRILDLLTVQDELPHALTLRRFEDRMDLRMALGEAQRDCAGTLIAKMRQISGVRSVSPASEMS